MRWYVLFFTFNLILIPLIPIMFIIYIKYLYIYIYKFIFKVRYVYLYLYIIFIFYYIYICKNIFMNIWFMFCDICDYMIDLMIFIIKICELDPVFSTAKWQHLEPSGSIVLQQLWGWHSCAWRFGLGFKWGASGKLETASNFFVMAALGYDTQPDEDDPYWLSGTPEKDSNNWTKGQTLTF